MEKELIQEPLFRELIPDEKQSENNEIPYEILLTDFVNPEEIEDTLFIDSVSPLPEGFPDINKYLEFLGTKVVDIKPKMNEIKIVFEGGHVTYYKEFKREIGDFDQYQVGEIVVYGATAAPGIRAIRTSKFDTHLHFNIHNEEYLKYAKEDDLLYTMKNGDILRITVSEPEDTDIKNTWIK